MTELEEAFISDKVWNKIMHKAFNKTIPKSLTGNFTGHKSRMDSLRDCLEGTYVFAPPTQREIPKDNGKMREIYTYGFLDRLILSAYTEALYVVFGDKYISKACIAYIEGLGVLKSVRQIMKSTEVRSGFKADLTSYFTSIPKEDVLEMMKETGQGTKLSECIATIYENDLAYVNGSLVEVKKGVGQGCALASFFSNMYLRKIDDAMLERYATYRRYSDDIIVFTEHPEEALEYFESLLKQYRPSMELNPAKVEIFTAQSLVTFLGWDIFGDDICLSQKHFNRIKKKLKHLTRPSLCGIKRAKGNKEYLRRVIRKVMKYLYFDTEVDGVLIGYANQSILGMTLEHEVKELSEYVRNRILKEYTGKFSSDANTCVSEEFLRSLGYVSLYDMWKRHRMNHDLYSWSVAKLKEFFRYRVDRYEVSDEISFNQLYDYLIHDEEEWRQDPGKLREILCHTDTSIFDRNNKWYLVLENIVIFRGELLGYGC